MARSRDLRPEYFQDEKVGELPFGARLLYPAIWIQANLRGVFDPSPKLLRVQAFPFDEGVKSANITEWMNKIVELEMVVRFESGGKQWAYVRNWLKYQGISNREIELAVHDRCPIPPGWVDPPRWLQIWSKIGASVPGSPTVRPSDVPVSSQGCYQDPSPSPSPSPASASSPSPSPAPNARTDGRTNDLDLFKPESTPATMVQVTDADEWRMRIGNEPWVRTLVAAGCKIGPNNWRMWRGLIDRVFNGKPENCAEFALHVRADERWPDQVESAMGVDPKTKSDAESEAKYGKYGKKP